MNGEKMVSEMEQYIRLGDIPRALGSAQFFSELTDAFDLQHQLNRLSKQWESLSNAFEEGHSAKSKQKEINDLLLKLIKLKKELLLHWNFFHENGRQASENSINYWPELLKKYQYCFFSEKVFFKPRIPKRILDHQIQLYQSKGTDLSPDKIMVIFSKMAWITGTESILLTPSKILATYDKGAVRSYNLKDIKHIRVRHHKRILMDIYINEQSFHTIDGCLTKYEKGMLIEVLRAATSLVKSNTIFN